MTPEYRTIKPEARILGLDSCKRPTVIGAIIRGGTYLDAVLSFNNTNGYELGQSIRSTRYYPELRFVMVHQRYSKGKAQFETAKLQGTTGLPTVEITQRTPIRKPRVESYARFVKKGKTTYAKSTLDHNVLSRLLDISWTFGDFPEPVRVAHLLANSIRFNDYPTIKDKNARNP